MIDEVLLFCQKYLSWTPFLIIFAITELATLLVLRLANQGEPFLYAYEKQKILK